MREDVGLHGSVPVWTVGSHDTASAVVAVPAVGDDFAYISCGTWSLVGLELDRPVLTEESRAANFTNEAGVDGTVRYLRNVMGLWVLQESIRTWNEAGLPADLPDLLAAAARVPALTTVVDLDGSAFLPPGDMPARIAAEAARTGQTPPQSQAETVRCILDSLALAYRRAVRQASVLADKDVSVVHVVGGGVRNELLCQLTADATGLPVVAGPVEGAALGNVLVQARAAGVLSGGLADLRAVGARGLELRRYEPGATGGPTDRQWAAAEQRVEQAVASLVDGHASRRADRRCCGRPCRVGRLVVRRAEDAGRLTTTPAGRSVGGTRGRSRPMIGPGRSCWHRSPAYAVYRARRFTVRGGAATAGRRATQQDASGDRFPVDVDARRPGDDGLEDRQQIESRSRGVGIDRSRAARRSRRRQAGSRGWPAAGRRLG